MLLPVPETNVNSPSQSPGNEPFRMTVKTCTQLGKANSGLIYMGVFGMLHAREKLRQGILGVKTQLSCKLRIVFPTLALKLLALSRLMLGNLVSSFSKNDVS